MTKWLRKSISGSSDIEISRIFLFSYHAMYSKAAEDLVMSKVQHEYPDLAAIMVWGKNAQLLNISGPAPAMIVAVRLKPLEVLQLSLADKLPPTRRLE
jgi:hypothetical protein